MLISIIYALPNTFKTYFAVEISSLKEQESYQELLKKLELFFKKENIQYEKTYVNKDNNKVIVHLLDEKSQIQSKTKIQNFLGRGYVTALNIITDIPKWLLAIGSKSMFLGLDLRGGVHFLMEIDTKSILKNNLEKNNQSIRNLLRKDRLYTKPPKITNDNNIVVGFANDDNRQKAIGIINDNIPNIDIKSVVIDNTPHINLSIPESEQNTNINLALKQNIITLKNRVNELGVSEPIVQQQGKNRIVIQLPGIQDTVRAKEILGAVATLEFRLVDENNDPNYARQTGRTPLSSSLYYFRDGRPLLLKNEVITRGDNVIDANSGFDQESGSPMVNIVLDSIGGRAMRKTTRNNINKRMSAILIENKIETFLENGEYIKKNITTEYIIYQATIAQVFSDRFRVTGLSSSKEARDIALLLRAGALSAPIEIIQESTVGPSLGKENIKRGFISVIIGFLLVLFFMIYRYKVFGFVANIALLFNLIMMIAVLSLLQATLTLPGIAGIVLTVGMAVDANVLIFERIREELKNTNTTVINAIANGYDRALLTIADANITTLIAAIVLFSFGTGPIKGFAVTLSIGIITSMFTSIILSRFFINLIYTKNRKIAQIKI